MDEVEAAAGDEPAHNSERSHRFFLRALFVVVVLWLAFLCWIGWLVYRAL